MKFFIFIIIIISSLISFSKELNRSDYAKLFIRENKINKADLGPQCVFNSLEEVKKAEAAVDDEDYKLSFDEFMVKITKLGLIDKSLFKNPDVPGDDGSSSIKSILDWTKIYQDNQLVYSPTRCFLSAKEIFSIFYYTGEGYRAFNNAIRNNNTDMINKLGVIGKHLGIGLQKLKPYDGFVKRIRKLNTKDAEKLNEFNKEHQVGNILTQTAYTSTTIGPNYLFAGNIEYIIRTHKNCHYIADFSLVEQKLSDGQSYQEEEEVLCLPKTKFKVQYHESIGDNHKIVMEEVIE